jgi:hypothetical protein
MDNLKDLDPIKCFLVYTTLANVVQGITLLMEGDQP